MTYPRWKNNILGTPQKTTASRDLIKPFFSLRTRTSSSRFRCRVKRWVSGKFALATSNDDCSFNTDSLRWLGSDVGRTHVARRAEDRLSTCFRSPPYDLSRTAPADYWLGTYPWHDSRAGVFLANLFDEHLSCAVGEKKNR